MNVGENAIRSRLLLFLLPCEIFSFLLFPVVSAEAEKKGKYWKHLRLRAEKKGLLFASASIAPKEEKKRKNATVELPQYYIGEKSIRYFCGQFSRR